MRFKGKHKEDSVFGRGGKTLHVIEVVLLCVLALATTVMAGWLLVEWLVFGA